MEFRKLFQNKKLIGILVVLLLVQVFLFLYSAQKQDEWEELVEEETLDVGMPSQYSKETFEDQINAIIHQADSLGAVSIFSDKNSFSQKNLEKTKEDYLPLKDVRIVEMDDLYLVRFLNHSMLNGIVIIAGILSGFCLEEEKKAGLRSMIYAASGGRSRLTIHKILALLGWSMGLTILFYGVTLLVSNVRYTGNLMECLSYPVQSIEILQKLPLCISIGEFLILYFVYGGILLFLIALLAWVVASCVDQIMISMGILGMIGILQFLLYYAIPVEHPANVLHYSSLWYLMYDSSVFTEYRNVQFLGMTMNKNETAGILWFLCGICLLAIAFWNGCFRYPCSSSSGLIKTKWNGIGKKLQKWYGGIPSLDSKDYIANLEAKLEQVIADYEAASVQYEQGKIEVDSYLEAVKRYEAFMEDIKFLEHIKEQQDYLMNLKEEKGIEGWYINYYSYNHLFQNEETICDVILWISIVLLCSGIFAYERKCGIEPIMKGSKRGREKIFQYKMMMAAAFFTCMLSQLKNQKFAIVFSLTLCVPSILTMVGFSFMKYLSIQMMFTVVPFLIQSQNVTIVAISCAAFIGLGIYSLVRCYRQWCVIR